MKRLLAFFGLSLALAIAPGPDILFVLAQSISAGALAGSTVSAGLVSGCFVHVTLAAFGFAAVMKRYPKLFTAVTWLGAAYLLYLAYLTFPDFSAPLQLNVQHATSNLQPSTSNLPALYTRGVIMNLCNPKVILFFLALMPRFIVPESGRIPLQFIGLGLLFILATFLVFNVVSLLGGTLSGLFSDPASRRFLDLLAALVMIGIAAWIVWRNLHVQKS